METVLGRVIAGGLVLVDAFLSCFVTASMTTGTFDCNAVNCGSASYYLGSTTLCGDYLIQQSQQLVVTLLQLGANILPALGVIDG